MDFPASKKPCRGKSNTRVLFSMSLSYDSETALKLQIHPFTAALQRLALGGESVQRQIKARRCDVCAKC